MNCPPAILLDSTFRFAAKQVPGAKEKYSRILLVPTPADHKEQFHFGVVHY